MKVLLLGAAAWPRIGGIENSLRFMAQSIRHRGGTARIVCFRAPEDLPLDEEFEGVRITRIPVATHRWPHPRLRIQVETAATALRHVLDEFQPDYVWSRYHTMGLAAVRAGAGNRVVQIFPITAEMASRDIISEKNVPMRQWVRQRIIYYLMRNAQVSLESKLIRAVKPVVFSELMRNELSKTYGVAHSTIEKIRPGVDHTTFSPQSSEKVLKLRNKLGLLAEDCVILCVGRLAAYKNIGMLVEAVSHLPDHVKLIIVGEGPMRSALERQALRLQVDKRIVFAGIQREELPDYYSLAKVTVVPSVVESFGQVYLESYACGTPAIGFSSALPQCTVATDEVIVDGKTGLICREYSSESLAASIAHLVELSDNEYSQLSQESLSTAKNNYSWDSTVSRLIQISDLHRSDPEEVSAV